jgi:hypothetical protein
MFPYGNNIVYACNNLIYIMYVRSGEYDPPSSKDTVACFNFLACRTSIPPSIWKDILYFVCVDMFMRCLVF